jgi:minor extracellular serine protease Vpr
MTHLLPKLRMPQQPLMNRPCSRSNILLLTILTILHSGWIATAQVYISPGISATALDYQASGFGTQAKTQAQRTPNTLQQIPGITWLENKPYIGAILEVNDSQFDAAAAQAQHGILVESQFGEVLTALIPLAAFDALAKGQVPGVLRVSGDRPLQAAMDSSRVDTRLDSVQSGTGLPNSYTGQGVIVGIIDVGFDYTHPVFRDETTNALKISRAWNHRDATGPAPSGRRYGTEYVGAEAILARQHDQTNEWHGTHVASIATASTVPGLPQYRGFAPAAEVVLVTTTFRENSILDGIDYIFKYAASVGKPVVINISIASRIGPRDGTSAFDRAIDSAIGPGKLVIGAMGNWGNFRYHWSDSLAIGDTVSSIATQDNQNGAGRTISDIWSAPRADVQVGYEILNGSGQTVYRSPRWLNGAAQNTFRRDTVLIATPSGGTDTVEVSYQTIPFRSNRNQRTEVVVIFEDFRQVNRYHFKVRIAGAGGQAARFHAWNANGSFQDTLPGFGPLAGLRRGDTLHTLTEIGATSFKVLTAGAHTIRRFYRTLGGEQREIFRPAAVGAIAPFTGIGPTLDGRTKPEVSAPGNTIAAAASSFASIGGEILMAEYREGDRKWPFALSHGTSMSAPMLAGTVALMLSINPKLGPDEIRPIITQGARRDAFTGEIGAEGSNTWGWGKLDVLESMRRLLASPLSISEKTTTASLGYIFYPNPTNDVVYIASTTAAQSMITPNSAIDVRLFNGIGQCVLRQQMPASLELFSISMVDLPTGLYTVQLQTAKGAQSMRVVKW